MRAEVVRVAPIAHHKLVGVVPAVAIRVMPGKLNVAPIGLVRRVRAVVAEADKGGRERRVAGVALIEAGLYAIQV